MVRVQMIMRQQKAMTARITENGVRKGESQERRQMVLKSSELVRRKYLASA